MTRPVTSKLNCEVLYDDLAFEVRWAIAGDSIVLQLVAKLDDGEYMSFGVSEDVTKSVMIGGDVVVAWVDKETLKGYAEDYYLEAKSQCSGPTGSCPDNRFAENTNSIRLLNAAMVNGYSIVTYQRSLQPADQYDHQIYTNKSQAIIWGIGPLNQRNEVSFHSHYPKGDHLIDFGRPAKWNCPMPENEQPPMKAIPDVAKTKKSERRQGTSKGNTDKSPTNTRSRIRGGQRGNSNYVRSVPTPAPVSKKNAWIIPPIQCDEPDDGVFYAQMGPTGGKHGYPAITGHVGWGISWYINGLLIPEINVVRGKTYTFVVEAGLDSDVPAKFHPFYITNDPVGGYEHKTDDEKKDVRIFAGVNVGKDGSLKPVGVGRWCSWTPIGDADADNFESFGAYQRHLELKCDEGEPGVIQWTPDKNTPNTVYYQCFTHRYLGWKINVLDSCDLKDASSELKPIIVKAPVKTKDLDSSSSIQIETRVKANNLINEDKEDKDKSTVSEKNPIVEYPKRQPNEPILIQSQQSFFNPPIYMDPGLFAQNTYHPYIIEHPFYYNPYQHMFRPSPVMHEEVSLVKSENATESNLVKVQETVPAPTEIKQVNETTYFPPLNTRPFRTVNNMIMRKPSNFQNYLPHPPPMKLPRLPPIRQIPFKSMYKPMMKQPPRPLYPKFLNKPMFMPNIPKRPQPYFVIKPPIRLPTHPIIRTQPEKEPEIQTAPTVKPAEPKVTQIVNSGFHPESVVIESGFKPIVHRRTIEEPQIQKRVLDEAEADSNIGVVDLNFGPVFLPSPIDKKKNETDDETEITAAAERIDSYYLPPPNQTEKKADLDSPPAIVVTYDGRKVSGASLTEKADRANVLSERVSQASELIKARPQFVPFQGELPPLNPEYINNAAQLQTTRLINRNLDTPPQAMKLKLIRKIRAAHHTPAHTAEQQQNTTNFAPVYILSLNYSIMVALILMYF